MNLWKFKLCTCLILQKYMYSEVVVSLWGLCDFPHDERSHTPPNSELSSGIIANVYPFLVRPHVGRNSMVLGPAGYKND